MLLLCLLTEKSSALDTLLKKAPFEYRWVSARKMLTHWSYVFLALTQQYESICSKK